MPSNYYLMCMGGKGLADMYTLWFNVHLNFIMLAMYRVQVAVMIFKILVLSSSATYIIFKVYIQ